MRRVNGWLRGATERGQPFVIVDKWEIYRTFLKPSRTGKASGRPLSIAHIERAITALRKISTAWKFEDIWYRPCNRGKNREEIAEWRASRDRFRRHRRIKATPIAGAQTVTPAAVFIRLLAYIKGAVKLNGRAHVDREFLRRFQITSGLPSEWIALAAQRVRGIAGCTCRRKASTCPGQVGKLVVEPRRARGRPRKGGGTPARVAAVGSLPQNCRGISSPVGREDQKQPSLRAVIPQAGSSNAAGAAAQNYSQPGTHSPPSQAPPSGTAPPFANHALRGSEPAPPMSDNAHAPAAPAGNAARLATGRTPPINAPPFEIAGRWVTPRKLARLARWLACRSGPMQSTHFPGCRVVFYFAYALNLADAYLARGFSARVIVAAYGRGVERSHQDSLDMDRPRGGRGERVEPQRPPSAAVHYAREILDADNRPAADRWREFFAAPPAPMKSVPPHRPRGPERRATPRPLPKIPPSNSVIPDSSPRPPAPDAELVAKWIAAQPPLPRARDAESVARLRAAIAAGEVRPENQAGAPLLTVAELLPVLEKIGVTLAQFTALPWANKKSLVERAYALRDNPPGDHGHSDQ